MSTCGVLWVEAGAGSYPRGEMTYTDTGLREGQMIQDFELPTGDGRTFRLYERLAAGPLILVFYRGDW